MSPDAPTYWRVMSWWLLLQCRATLRFDDHRGIVPAELDVSESGLLGKLKRSKVTRPDKAPLSTPCDPPISFRSSETLDDDGVAIAGEGSALLS